MKFRGGSPGWQAAQANRWVRGNPASMRTNYVPKTQLSEIAHPLARGRSGPMHHGAVGPSSVLDASVRIDDGLVTDTYCATCMSNMHVAEAIQ